MRLLLNRMLVVALVLGLVILGLLRGAFRDKPDTTHPETGEEDAK